MSEKQNDWKEVSKKIGNGVLKFGKAFVKYGLPTALLAGQIFLAVVAPPSIGILLILDAVSLATYLEYKENKKAELEYQKEMDDFYEITNATAQRVDSVKTLVNRVNEGMKEMTGEEFEIREFLQK